MAASMPHYPDHHEQPDCLRLSDYLVYPDFAGCFGRPEVLRCSNYLAYSDWADWFDLPRYPQRTVQPGRKLPRIQTSASLAPTIL